MNGAGDFWEDIEVLTVETPENLELRLPLSGFGPRFLALLIDSLIQGVAAFILILLVFVIAMPYMSNIEESEAAMWMIVTIFILVLFLITVGYFALFETIWNGQTPGKRITGIRVVKRGGLPLTFRDAFLRNLFRIIDNLPSYSIVGLVAFFATKYQQRLGDLIAGTVVIREFKSGAPMHWPGAGSDRLATPGQSVLTPKLSYVIGSYLSRSRSLTIDDRIDLTAEIIRQLGYDPNPLNLNERENYLASILYPQTGVAQ